jgi:hypothetical protein
MDAELPDLVWPVALVPEQPARLPGLLRIDELRLPLLGKCEYSPRRLQRVIAELSQIGRCMNGRPALLEKVRSGPAVCLNVAFAHTTVPSQLHHSRVSWKPLRWFFCDWSRSADQVVLRIVHSIMVTGHIYFACGISGSAICP